MNTFFGRTELLRNLEEDLLRYQGIGLFGLRKSGKSSVLHQLSVTLRQHPVIHLDLQAVGGGSRYAASQFKLIIDCLFKLLSARTPGSAPRFEPFAEDAIASTVTMDFAQRITLLAEKLKEAGFKLPIICLLDEIERILPSPEDSRQKVEEFNAFFGTLRALCQQQRLLSLLVTDVHPDCNRINQWTQSGIPTNPVFKFFKEVFISSLSTEDTEKMLITIGSLMGYKDAFDKETLTWIHQVSGGHPFISRQLASIIYQKGCLKEDHTITWADAQRYIDKALKYSDTLRNYIGESIWGDLEKRKSELAMTILKVLACNGNANEWMAETTLRKYIGNQFIESQLLDALQWLEAVGLIDRRDATKGSEFDTSRIRLQLLSQWILMNLDPKEVSQWQSI
jgi:hypothetical protein